MKRLSFLSILALSIFTTSCQNRSDKAKISEKQEVSTSIGKQFVADTATSIINWRATHKGGTYPHWGNIKITKGNFALDNGMVTGGNFTIDMNSITVDSASVTANKGETLAQTIAKLTGHLKAPDFFDVANHPTAKFEITKARSFNASKDKSLLTDANQIVSGNLSIKGKTVNLTFPATITITNDVISVKAKFMVDRTTWNLNFGTKNDPNPANWMVSKDFELDINVYAKPIN